MGWDSINRCYAVLAEAGIVGRDAELSLRRLGHMVTFPDQKQRAVLEDPTDEALVEAFGADSGRVAVVLHRAGLLK